MAAKPTHDTARSRFFGTPEEEPPAHAPEPVEGRERRQVAGDGPPLHVVEVAPLGDDLQPALVERGPDAHRDEEGRDELAFVAPQELQATDPAGLV
jgi:hypothetical protein